MKHIVFLLFFTLFSAASVLNAANKTFSNDHFKVSFFMPDDNWKIADRYSLAPTTGWLVEYVNSTNFAFIAFAGAKNRLDNRSAMGTVVSMLKSESSSAWVVRPRSIWVGKYKSTAAEVRFITQKLPYSGVILVFRVKDRQFRFFFGAPDQAFADAFSDFLRVLSSVRVR